MKIIDIITQVFDIIDKTDKNESLKEKLFGNDDGKGPLKKLINYAIKKDQDLLSYKLNTGEDNTLLSVLMERNAHEILRLIFENDKLLSSTSSSFADEEGIKYPTEKFNKKLIASLNNGSYEALHLLVNKFPRLCHDIYNIDDQSLTREGKEILERLKKEINQSITNLTINNDHESLENFLLSIKEPECFENFLPEEKLIVSLNNGSYEALSKLVVRNQNLRKYVIDLQDTSSLLTEKGPETLEKLKKVILVDLIVYNKDEDLECFSNSIKKPEDLKKIIPILLNDQDLNEESKRTLKKLQIKIITNFLIENNHEALGYLVDSIKKGESLGLLVEEDSSYIPQECCSRLDFDLLSIQKILKNSSFKLLPIKIFRDSLNNGSYEALSKLDERILDKNQWPDGLFSSLSWSFSVQSSSLNKKGQDVFDQWKSDKWKEKAKEAENAVPSPPQSQSYQQQRSHSDSLYCYRSLFDNNGCSNRYSFQNRNQNQSNPSNDDRRPSDQFKHLGHPITLFNKGYDDHHRLERRPLQDRPGYNDLGVPPPPGKFL